MKKDALNPEAPWSSRSAKKSDWPDRGTAVVYVLSEESSEWTKVGVTTELRRRISTLDRQKGTNLQIQFWAEYSRGDAQKVEARAKKILRSFPYERDGEWFKAEPDIVAGAICLAAKIVGAHTENIAGFPSAPEYDDTFSEIDLLLSEPCGAQATKGRMDREFWSPQGRSKTY